MPSASASRFRSAARHGTGNSGDRKIEADRERGGEKAAKQGGLFVVRRAGGYVAHPGDRLERLEMREADLPVHAASPRDDRDATRGDMDGDMGGGEAVVASHGYREFLRRLELPGGLDAQFVIGVDHDRATRALQHRRLDGGKRFATRNPVPADILVADTGYARHGAAVEREAACRRHRKARSRLARRMAAPTTASWRSGRRASYLAVLEQVPGELRTGELKLDVPTKEAGGDLLTMFDFIFGHFAVQPQAGSVPADDRKRIGRPERIGSRYPPTATVRQSGETRTGDSAFTPSHAP